jgi:hypothetical protein
LLRENIACNAEISLRGPAATKMGVGENVTGDRAKKSVERSRSAGVGPAPGQGRFDKVKVRQKYHRH